MQLYVCLEPVMQISTAGRTHAHARNGPDTPTSSASGHTTSNQKPHAKQQPYPDYM